MLVEIIARVVYSERSDGSQQHRESPTQPGSHAAGHRDQEAAGPSAER